MSFLGFAGHLMAATGLTQLLEVFYAGNTEKHILSGSAMARAIRVYPNCLCCPKYEDNSQCLQHDTS